MAARTFTVELDEDQARIVAEIAAAHDLKPEAVLIDAIGHGLAMIVAGVDDSDLIEPWDRPGAQQGQLAEPGRTRRKPKRLRSPEDDNHLGDDLPI